METRWSDFGFSGSLLLVLYGILSLLIFFTPPSFYGLGAPIIAIAMALLAISGAILFSLGFFAMQAKYELQPFFSSAQEIQHYTRFLLYQLPVAHTPSRDFRSRLVLKGNLQVFPDQSYSASSIFQFLNPLASP